MESFLEKLSTDSRLLRYIIETKKEKVVTHSRFDPQVKVVKIKKPVKKKLFSVLRSFIRSSVLAVISLIALTREQQERINDNITEFSDYVRHVSSIFVSRLLEDQSGSDNIQKMFLTMLDNMDRVYWSLVRSKKLSM
jgi:transcriptional regulator with PAS, ATPase and Fis domain